MYLPPTRWHNNLSLFTFSSQRLTLHVCRLWRLEDLVIHERKVVNEGSERRVGSGCTVSLCQKETRRDLPSWTDNRLLLVTFPRHVLSRCEFIIRVENVQHTKCWHCDSLLPAENHYRIKVTTWSNKKNIWDVWDIVLPAGDLLAPVSHQPKHTCGRRQC